MANVLTVRNPYTGEVVGEVPCCHVEELNRGVETAAIGAAEMRATTLHQRRRMLAVAAERLVAHRAELSALLTSESGKTIRETCAEVARAASIFELAAAELVAPLGDVLALDALPNGAGMLGYCMREPRGVIGAITPWNVPLALAAHKIAPALAAGNSVVLKPAEQTPLSSLLMCKLLVEAGIPANALVVCTGLGEEVGAALVRHPGVAMVSFTGSREVGVALPAAAGFKKVSLELGGNSPLVVTPSANLEAAAGAIVRGAFAVAGQLCISVQRVIAHRSIMANLVSLVSEATSKLVVGDPASEATDVGTLISSEACQRVEGLVNDLRQAGAQVLTGGSRLGECVYQPTVLGAVVRDHPAVQQEAFGPIVMFIAYEQFSEAVQIANSTEYGLNVAIWTNSHDEAMAGARELQAGTVIINESTTFRSDLMPYGGIKQSGMGREGVRFAIEEMSITKTICYGRSPGSL
jgi:glyceraldehyde-3-phosphate dehydrogenase (NADP+)